MNKQRSQSHRHHHAIRVDPRLADRNDMDWSAPMLAVQHLTTLPSPVSATSTEFANNDLSLSMILPEGRIDYLLDLFNAQYTPWLNFQPIRNSSNPLVDIACSAVAARHLDSASGQEVRIRLQNLTTESIAQMIFKPGSSESVEAVQCLLILSLWGPFDVAPEIPGWDTKTFISTAVRMAMELRLNHASAAVNEMRKQECPDSANMAEALERSRLWVSLSNAESMLSLGTRRTPLSRRGPEDHLLIRFPPLLNAQSELRNLRLGLAARSLDLFEEGASICLEPDKQEWAQDMKSVLERMKRENRLLQPLPVVMDRDQFYFHVLHILHDACRLLVLYHGLSELRTSMAQHPPGPQWPKQFRPRGAGESVSSRLARDMLQTSERLLISFLATPIARLCTAPDAYFHMVSLAAAYLVGAKFLFLRMTQGRLLLGASDLLLARTVTTLHRAACGPGHAAHRCALLVQGMVEKWHSRDRPSPTTPEANPRPAQANTVPDFGMQVDAASVLSSLLSLEVPLPPEFLNAMPADDAEFWDTDQLTW
ncbi:hypothetical protein MSAN_01233300 [Mycena sanguinolenta]|uniref:Transcription factor domain-containing protein n=1 Tax=Mycena sanguinolenta TaxID=230812 RepID=A0A8H7D1U9_9AGAR|nr:hypothetical protein MSAN_01233300 [Mycena sanguinolenta]